MSMTLGRAGTPRSWMTAGLAAVALLVLGAPVAFAQTRTVAGRVTEARTGQAIGAAAIEVAGTRRVAIADAEGRYRITDVPAGRHEIVARRIGYTMARQTVVVPDEGETRADFVLQPAPLSLDQVVVTGTAGAERLRTIGNSVATISASDVMPLAQAPSFTSLLNARAPGVLINQVTGRLGAAPSIEIRGRSSIGLGNAPLLYIDGVRVNNSTGLGASGGGFGAQGSSVAGRLNDINPDDIESIEVIKGPAASTIYGTEASAGVIQIITKRGVASQAPRFAMRVQHGSIFFRDAEGRLPTNYMRDPSGNVVTWNAIQQEEARGTPLFRTGRSTEYFGSLSGGIDQLRYYASASYDDEKGVEPNNFTKQFTLHTNLDIPINSKINVGTTLHYVDLRNHLGTDNGVSAMLGAMYGHILLQPEARGFGLGFPPELSWQLYDNSEDVRRFTASGTVNYTPTSWMVHSLLLGVDYTGGDHRTLERFASAELAEFLTPTQAAGRIGQTLRRNSNITVNYAGTATASVMPALTSSTSIGLQVARMESDASSLGGMGFPAPGVETVSGTATPLPASQTEILNTTVGAFLQEKFGWNDRLFLTAAVRVDNNSAFGEDFKWIVYPKADVSWVISEEPFWQWHDVVNTLRLRAAYGESGRAPVTFSALRTFTPVQGPNGVNAVTPGSLGNPDLKPERGKEWEVGFETALLDRFTLDFTYFSKKTLDLIINQPVAPSSGFAGNVPLNLGRVDNSGFEVQGTFDALRREDVEWQIVASVATNEDEIKELGAVSGAVSSAGGANRVGHPIGGLWSRVVVSADRDPVTNRATNVLCDGGPGNAPVACTAAPFIFLGSPAPKTTGAISNTLTIARRLRLYALVDFKRDYLRFNNDKILRCTGAVGAGICEENVYPERFSPVVLAQTAGAALTQGLQQLYFEDGSFVKLREVAASYDLPERWIRGLSSASITVSGRELATWTDFTGTDPENAGQAILPPLSRFTATLTIGF